MLILASASPRRKDLLRSAGISFTAQPADLDESPLPDETARACAERLAREKAMAVWRTWPENLVLGADTVVVVDGIILGKPADVEDAARMLRLLSGRQHEVITGVCLVSAVKHQQPCSNGPRPYVIERTKKAEIRIGSESTRVTLNQLSDDDIHQYVASGEPMDKAGAYAIQGLASRWIPRIEGDYSNVVGLPVALVYQMLGDRQNG
ncbi:MAG: Maf family protein [Candidatus Sulfotelmatobacter sp.]